MSSLSQNFLWVSYTDIRDDYKVANICFDSIFPSLFNYFSNFSNLFSFVSKRYSVRYYLFHVLEHIFFTKHLEVEKKDTTFAPALREKHGINIEGIIVNYRIQEN